MRAAVAVLLVSLAACTSSSSQHRIPDNHAGPPPVLSPVPHIAWHNAHHPPFELTRLPAVARSGEVAILPLQDNDAGRGNVNLRFELRDRADRLVDKFVVMTANEYEQFVPDGEQATLPLNDRIASANRKLADLHSQHDFTAMRAFDASETAEQMTPIAGDGFVVTFGDDHKLHVRAQTGPDLATADGSAWLAPTGKRCAQCPPCENPARLDAFYKAPEINVVVVRITYGGTDTCWEPPDQLHVVTW
jgi:hypothetical protein